VSPIFTQKTVLCHHALHTDSPSLSLPSVQRLMKDFKKIQAEQRIGLEASPNPTNIMQWNAVMAGPEDTPWDGGEQISGLSLLTMLPSCKLVVHVSLTTSCEGGLAIKISCCCHAGQFKLILEFSEQYPNEPPKVKFLSTIFHPNGETSAAISCNTTAHTARDCSIKPAVDSARPLPNFWCHACNALRPCLPSSV